MQTAAVVDDNENIDILALSGSITAYATEFNDLVYGEYDTSIRFAIAKMLISWNKNYPFDASYYDKKFIGVLFREVIGKRDVETTSIAFIKRLFEIRIKGDNERLEAFDEIIDNLIRGKANKKTK